MNNSKIFANGAILTAIWDETKKDNLELIKPFVEFLIGINYRKGDKINNILIIRQMDERFFFSRFPEAILIKVYGRLKNILERTHGEYYLKKDLSKECQDFEERQVKLQEETEKVIEALKGYLKTANSRYKNIDNKETSLLLTLFMEKMGFLTIEKVKEYENIENYKKDQNNFFIAKFIICEFENKSVISKYLERIISGFMLANAIYMQVESDNKETLKKVDIYLDAPLLLNILNFKTVSQNESGNLLMQLLKEKNANIYCFRHNFDEVYSILESYKNNLSTIREKTLEGLDIEGYNKTDVERIMGELEMMLNNRGITIKDTPTYDKDYKGIIDEKKLTSFLLENYSDNKEKIEGVVERDVKSISAIGRIRRERVCKKIEDCMAIFVTTNYNLVDYAESCLEHKKYEEIGFLITDVDIITILWLKSFKKNPDLPKLKLIENARASLELTPKMMNRVKDVIEKMVKEGTINQADVVSANIQELNYYKKELMEKIDGDEDNITEHTILGIIDKSNIQLKQELSAKKQELEKITAQREKQQERIKEFEENTREACRKKSRTIITILKNVYNIISIIVLLVVLFWSIYIKSKNYIPFQGLSMLIVVTVIFEIIGIIDLFVPKFSRFKKWVFKKLDDLGEKIFLYILHHKKEEYKSLIQDK